MDTFIDLNNIFCYNECVSDFETEVLTTHENICTRNILKSSEIYAESHCPITSTPEGQVLNSCRYAVSNFPR